jgi:hypothetical protein
MIARIQSLAVDWFYRECTNDIKSVQPRKVEEQGAKQTYRVICNIRKSNGQAPYNVVVEVKVAPQQHLSDKQSAQTEAVNQCFRWCGSDIEYVQPGKVQKLDVDGNWIPEATARWLPDV